MTTPIGDFSRISGFQNYVVASGIPLVGISNTNDTVEGLAFQYGPTVTQANEDWVANAVSLWDWRSQVPLTVQQVASQIGLLAPSQVETALNTAAAAALLANPDAAAVLQASGVPVSTSTASPT